MVQGKFLKSKIHRATVTQADLEYEGSITIDSTLLEAAGMSEYEAVNVWNVTSGSRFETYTMRGEPDSGCICINGAAAHLAAPGDLVIIAAFNYFEAAEAADYEPRLVFVDQKNRIKELGREVPGPNRRSQAA